MKNYKYLIVILLFVSVNAVAGKPKLIWQVGENIDYVEKPNGFVVTPKEIHSVIPLTHSKWNIYADENSYYLSSGVQKLLSKTGDNSYLAKTKGIKISGKTRKEFELINKAKKGKVGLPPATIRKILANEK